jgi:hypothetical protein
MRVRVSTLVLALVSGACGGKSVGSAAGGIGRTDGPNFGGSGGSGQVSPDAGGSGWGQAHPDGGGAINPRPRPPPGGDGSLCTEPLGSTRESYVAPSSCEAAEAIILGAAASVEELHALFFGQWLLCDATSVFGSRDEIGFELVANGQWFKLYPDGSGGVERGQGADREGTFELIDVGESVQVNLMLANGLTVIVHPQFSGRPRKVRLNNNGVYEADYVSNDSEGRCVPGTSAPPLGKYTPPATCAQNPTPEPQPPGVDGMRAAISGKWALCNTPSTFGTSDEGGLEITSAGEWFKLYPNPAGELVRGQGFEKQGTYSLIDLGGFVQLNLEIAGSGTVITSPQIGSTPRALRLNNNGVFEGRYVGIGP